MSTHMRKRMAMISCDASSYKQYKPRSMNHNKWEYFGYSRIDDTSMSGRRMSDGRQFVVLNLLPGDDNFLVAFADGGIDSWLVIEPETWLPRYAENKNIDYGLPFLPDLVLVDMRRLREHASEGETDKVERKLFPPVRTFRKSEVLELDILVDRANYIADTAEGLEPAERMVMRTIFNMLIRFETGMNRCPHGYRPTVIFHCPKYATDYNSLLYLFIKFCCYDATKEDIDLCCFGEKKQRSTVMWHHCGKDWRGLDWDEAIDSGDDYACKWCQKDLAGCDTDDMVPHSSKDGWPRHMCTQRMVRHIDEEKVNAADRDVLPQSFYRYLSRKIRGYFWNIKREHTEVIRLHGLDMSEYITDQNSNVGFPYRYIDYWFAKMETIKEGTEEEKRGGNEFD